MLEILAATLVVVIPCAPMPAPHEGRSLSATESDNALIKCGGLIKIPAALCRAPSLRSKALGFSQDRSITYMLMASV